MEICDITECGTYVVATLGNQFTLEVSRQRDPRRQRALPAVLWGELTCFTTRVADPGTLFEERELNITGPDDRYIFKPIADFEGEVVKQLLELT